MTGSQIDVLLKTMALVGTLLLIGTFLRAKVSLFQNLFLPACVIGGIIGLILGPRMLGVLPISDEIMTTASNMPGRFFALIIAALPMCSQKLKKGELFQRIDAIKLGIIISLISALQFAIGFLTNIVFTKLGLEMYSGYGLEMMLGFCGGHGTAATVGGILQNLGQDYWEVAQGMAMTFSTIGMVGGIMIGITVINIVSRKGLTNYVKDPGALPKEMKTGLYSTVDECPSAGRITTAGGSIDTLGLHLALIFLSVGAGYVINYMINKYQIPGLTYLSSGFWMLMSMYVIWFAVRKLNCEQYFDANIKSRIQGCVTDFIVTAAIFSMPIEMIAEYWLPLLTTSVLGFVVTVSVLLFLDKMYLSKDWIEKSMGPLGMLTGDFITGVLLTRMVDPDFKSEAMGDFSIAYSINTFYCVAMLAILFPFVVKRGAMAAMIFTVIHAVIFMVALCLVNLKKKG